MRPAFALIVLCLALSPAGRAWAAESLTELYAAVPAPPADPATAQKWVREGQVAAPQAQAFEARLADLKTPGSGAAAAGAAEVLEDPPAVQACVAAYKSYLASGPGGQASAQVLGARLSSLARAYTGLKRRTSHPELLQDIRQQELTSYRALFEDWKSKRGPVIDKAQRELLLAGEPSSIRNAESRAMVLQYRQAMVGEIEALFSVTLQAVEAAAGILDVPAAATEPGPSTLWDLMANPGNKADPS